MGNCSAKLCAARVLTPAPTVGVDLTSDEVAQIISEQLKVPREQTKIGDRDYFAYAKSDLERFLSSSYVDSIKYVAERFDCDDFSYALMGREKEWYSQSPYNRGSTFGIVWGDIRNSETDTEIRAHAVNFFIDNNRELWLVEPQNDNIFKATKNSTFWNTIL